jgi:hypothetical protein
MVSFYWLTVAVIFAYAVGIVCGALAILGYQKQQEK